MSELNGKSPTDILQNLASVLSDEDCEPDDLIYAFGDVEASRAEVAELLTELLEQQKPNDRPAENSSGTN